MPERALEERVCSKDSTRTQKLLLLLFPGGEGEGVMEDDL